MDNILNYILIFFALVILFFAFWIIYVANRWWLLFWTIIYIHWYTIYDEIQFKINFCKVEFLCYQGDPNWLGAIFIYVIGFSVMSLSLYLIFDKNKSSNF